MRTPLPDVSDGPTLWRIARDPQVLGLNLNHALSAGCRDLARTTVVALADCVTAGFVAEFLRQEALNTVLVVQVLGPLIWLYPA